MSRFSCTDVSPDGVYTRRFRFTLSARFLCPFPVPSRFGSSCLDLHLSFDSHTPPLLPSPSLRPLVEIFSFQYNELLHCFGNLSSPVTYIDPCVTDVLPSRSCPVNHSFPPFPLLSVVVAPLFVPPPTITDGTGVFFSLVPTAVRCLRFGYLCRSVDSGGDPGYVFSDTSVHSDTFLRVTDCRDKSEENSKISVETRVSYLHFPGLSNAKIELTIKFFISVPLHTIPALADKEEVDFSMENPGETRVKETLGPGNREGE